MTRVYLAGPEVFLREAVVIGAEKVVLCARYGLEGVLPTDSDRDLEGLSPVEAGLRIAAANEALMRSCALTVANLSPFRDPSADAGIIFEVGFIRALCRPVLGYATVDRSYRDRVADHFGGEVGAPAGVWYDPQGCVIEDLRMDENLMVIGAPVGRRLVFAETPADRRYCDLTAFERCLELAHDCLETTALT